MRTIIAVSNPAWGDADHAVIICNVTTKEAGGPYPFAATASDPEPHGRQLWNELNAGKHGAIADYVAPPPAPAPSSSGTQKL